MEFKLIRNEVIKEADKFYNTNIKTEEDYKKALPYKKEYKGDFEQRKKKLLKFLRNKKEKYIVGKFNHIKRIEEAPDSLPNPLIITIEWKRSRMWGSNPTASTNYGFIGDSIGGCGYCKTSTATAEALNSQLTILKRLFKSEERRLKEKPTIPERRAYIGYGSGHNAIPSFEGGVGVSSHASIIEGLGMKWTSITQAKRTDIFMIENQ